MEGLGAAMRWWRARPPWLRWSMWAAMLTAVATVASFAKALDTLDPLLPATHGYVQQAVRPLLVIGLHNTIVGLEGKRETLRARLDMAEARLRLNPDDPFIKAARDALVDDLNDVELEKAQANCDLREARGLTCAR